MVDGVTTNPSIIAKSGKDFKDVIKEICSITPGPVSAEVTATNTEGMIEEGLVLSKIAKNVAIKVPLTWAGLEACKDTFRSKNYDKCYLVLFLLHNFIGCKSWSNIHIAFYWKTR